MKGVKREGYPDPQSLRGSLPPHLFTYEVAHGSRIGIPVTLPKRHGSPRDPGPGNPPPQLSGSRLHPLGVPGSSSSPERFPGSGWRLRILPGRYEAPAPGVRRRGGDAGTGTRAPAHLPRAPRNWRGGAAASSRWDSPAAAATWSPREGRGERAPDLGGPLAPAELDRPGATEWEFETPALIPPPTGQIAAFLCASCTT